MAFDYDTGAELFPSKGSKSKHHAVRYRRFARAADAIRFAIEELPPALLLGAYLEVDEERFDSAGIRALYDSDGYPLVRAGAKQGDRTIAAAGSPDGAQRHPGKRHVIAG